MYLPKEGRLVRTTSIAPALPCKIGHIRLPRRTKPRARDVRVLHPPATAATFPSFAAPHPQHSNWFPTRSNPPGCSRRAGFPDQTPASADLAPIDQTTPDQTRQTHPARWLPYPTTPYTIGISLAVTPEARHHCLEPTHVARKPQHSPTATQHLRRARPFLPFWML